MPRTLKSERIKNQAEQQLSPTNVRYTEKAERQLRSTNVRLRESWGVFWGVGCRLRCLVLIGLLWSLANAVSVGAAEGFLQMRNGYFWDPAKGDYFIARGVAYQSWNPPVGANQSLAQLDYDLVEFKKMRANSVRCEFTWGEIQKGTNDYDWQKPDYLISRAEQLGLKLFILIGYQYPPAWFPPEYHGVNNEYTTSNIPTEVPTNVLSNVMNYEHPEAQRIYSNYIAAVAARYQGSPAVGAWIVGNEYAYYDLWEDPEVYPVHRFVGYDPISQASFRAYLQAIYQTNITWLNTNWQSAYTRFDDVVMPKFYPGNRSLPGYHDLVQWRKHSLADLVAIGAQAAKKADTHHLISYSLIGSIFSGLDANYTAEDIATIVARCKQAGAPLDFCAVNNYPWPSVGSEMRSEHYGVAKIQAQSGLPVMMSETGFTSTETIMDPGLSGARQPQALPSGVWECFMSGAIGVHFFHWNDRNLYPEGTVLYRENGFGITQENRQVKQPVYTNMITLFQQLANLRIEHLLGGSSNPPPDVQFFWSTNADMIFPRANQENAMLWGALKRLGYQPGILDDGAFERGDYRRSPVLLLDRCLQMNPSHLQLLSTAVIPAGIHVHASADLPGQFDAYNRLNPLWSGSINSLFGVAVGQAYAAVDSMATNNMYAPITLQGAAYLGPLTPSTRLPFQTWKIWQGLTTTTAQTIMTDLGAYNLASDVPALLVKINPAGMGRTALNTFAFGDTYAYSGTSLGQWDMRYNLLQAIYRTHFGLQPVVELTGTGAHYVMPNYRFCANGSVLISLLNEYTNNAILVVSAPSLLQGRKVERLPAGGILTTNSTGSLSLTVAGDECAVLYVYPTDGQTDQSLVNSHPNKLWFASAPLAVWPGVSSSTVSMSYDLQGSEATLYVGINQVSPLNNTYSRSAPTPVQGKGTTTVQVPLPDADLGDPNYLSSRQGAEYVFHAWLEQAGVVISDSEVPVRLLWGVHPTAPVPASLVAGQTYGITLEWEELPSYQPDDPTPFDRAPLWDSLDSTTQHYQVVLELLSQGQLVASNSFLTRQGTASHTFNLQAPTGTAGGFTWVARLETATNVLTHVVDDSFEGRLRGATWPSNMTVNFTAPWNGYTYANPNTNQVNLWQNQGVQLLGSDGSQSAFMVVTNPPGQDYSGFGISLQFPAVWALPADVGTWTNYSFSYDFMELNGHACDIEMQVKSVNERWIQFSQIYNPTNGPWNRVTATLDQFVRPEIPGVFDYFDPQHVSTLVLNIRMLDPSVQYVGSFDRVQFLGPETNLGGGTLVAAYSSANDSPGPLHIELSGPGPTLTWPGNGILQSATQVNGVWTDLPEAKSPWPLQPLEPGLFYRLRH
jgi:hypothetical protein